MPYHYIIIGTGVAGLAAAEAIRKKDPSGHLTIVGDDRSGYYSRPALAYYLNQTLPEEQIYPRSAPQLRALIPTRIYAHVSQILPEQHEVVLADGRHLCYDRLLLATGSRSTMLRFPGNDLQGVVTFYSMEDVRHILQLLKRCRSAIVIGDGIIGIELAEGLASHGAKVQVFMLGDRLWPMVFDEAESRLVEHGMEHQGIRLRPETQLAEAIGKGGVLSSVITKAGETIPCQILGVAVGVLSQMELAQQSGLATDRGILVNEYLETSAQDIFAAGNVAQVRDPLTGKLYMETLWDPARKQGWVAGSNMACQRTAYTRETSFNVVCIGEMITATIGSIEKCPLTVVSSDRRSWQICRQETDVDHADPASRVRVLIGEKTILGAVVMGDQTMAQPLLEMIRAETDISSIRQVLEMDPDRAVERIARFYQEEARKVVQYPFRKETIPI